MVSLKEQKFLTYFAFEKKKWPVVPLRIQKHLSAFWSELSFFDLCSGSGFLTWFLSLRLHALFLINPTIEHLLVKAASTRDKWGVGEGIAKPEAKPKPRWHFLWPLGREMSCLLKYFLAFPGFKLTANSSFHSQLTKSFFRYDLVSAVMLLCHKQKQENRDPPKFCEKIDLSGNAESDFLS